MPLVLIPTPVGNLGDITLRALEELKSADLIACEDTRHSGLLLAHYGIKRPLMSYQKFNEQSRVAEILARLAKGEKIAVISDAGTPGMSDPGWIALKAAIDAGYETDVLPGATAFVPAVLLSGLPPQPFSFVGFLSDQKGERRAQLQKLVGHGFTLVFYLSPHKAARQLEDFVDVLGDRRAALVREISKVYQEARRGTLSEILKSVEDGVKGELVLVVEGCTEPPAGSELDWKSEAERRRAAGEPVKKIAEDLAARTAVPKNRIKNWLLSGEERC
ncbi:MAG: 16S rRNA (cytidine(1402)-2'-O)-methyltransferase [Pyramidobacter sp.]